MAKALYIDMDSEPEEDVAPGPVFKLGGEEFHCVDRPPGAAIYDVMSLVSRDGSGAKVYSFPDLLTFIPRVLIEERTVTGEDGVEVTEPADDVERWNALMNDKRRPIDAKKIGDLAGSLIKHYTTRPT